MALVVDSVPAVVAIFFFAARLPAMAMRTNDGQEPHKQHHKTKGQVQEHRVGVKARKRRTVVAAG